MKPSLAPTFNFTNTHTKKSKTNMFFQELTSSSCRWENKDCLHRCLDTEGRNIYWRERRKDVAFMLGKSSKCQAQMFELIIHCPLDSDEKDQGSLGPTGLLQHRALWLLWRCSALCILRHLPHTRTSSPPCHSHPHRCCTLLPGTPKLLCRHICCSEHHICSMADMHHKLSQLTQEEYSCPCQRECNFFPDSGERASCTRSETMPFCLSHLEHIHPRKIHTRRAFYRRTLSSAVSPRADMQELLVGGWWCLFAHSGHSSAQDST